MGARALQSCPALCDAVGCSPPGSSARGVLQARTLECVAIPSSRASSQPRDQTHSPSLACIVRWVKIPLAPRWKGPAFLKPKPGGREELKLTHTQSGHRAPGGCPLKAETRTPEISAGSEDKEQNGEETGHSGAWKTCSQAEKGAEVP